MLARSRRNPSLKHVYVSAWLDDGTSVYFPQTAGGKGWSQVYKVRSYHVPLNDETLGIMVKLMKKYAPDHKPIWTVLGISALALKEMRVEIDVTAHLG